MAVPLGVRAHRRCDASGENDLHAFSSDWLLGIKYLNGSLLRKYRVKKHPGIFSAIRTWSDETSLEKTLIRRQTKRIMDASPALRVGSGLWLGFSKLIPKPTRLQSRIEDLVKEGPPPRGVENNFQI